MFTLICFKFVIQVKPVIMDFIGLEDSRLNVEKIVDMVKSPKCGAVSMFIGTTRDNCDGLKVL